MQNVMSEPSESDFKMRLLDKVVETQALEDKLIAKAEGRLAEDPKPEAKEEPAVPQETPHVAKPIDPDSESIVIKNSRIRVVMIVPTGKNIMETETNFTVSMEAHDVQVSEDFISILYKRSLEVIPPPFKDIKLKINGALYTAMCMGIPHTFGNLANLSFAIRQTEAT